jgi:G6PDH family F420-dependent oxidoreductase
MATIGIFLSSEEHGASFLVETARRAEEAGFRAAWISDHFHPWTDEQGESPFVWATIGGIAFVTREMKVSTAVTCPTTRLHPAIVAQAAATAATMLPGNFVLGVGSGEALNEHILGDPWLGIDWRLGMLEEAVAIIRELWTGKQVSHDGMHYTVDRAQIYSLPDEPPPILVSGFGSKAISLAARIGDGFVNTGPSAEALQQYRDAGGTGIAQTGVKVCWAPDEQQARRTAHRLWPNEALPGELAQVLPAPAHFEQATELVTEDMVAEAVPCGPDPERHVAHLRECIEAGYDEVYVQQIGDDQQGFLDFYAREVLPALN